jgi:4-amino-4-deoxy-L-arabinose transferase-like glycosyltransferase
LYWLLNPEPTKLKAAFKNNMLQKTNNLSKRNYLLLLLGVFSFSRLATWLFPYDSDHWIFYYIGRRWSEGSTLYLDMWDHKSPLIYAYNGLLHKLFGDNIVLHRLFFTVLALLGVWLFYKVAVLLYRQLKLKNSAGLARFSTLVFAFIANLAVFTNSGNNNENLGLVFLLVTLYFYLKWRQDPLKLRSYLLLSGSMGGFVFTLKANFAALLLPIVIDLVIVSRKNIYRLISNLCFWVAGPLLQLLIWALYFQQIGTFKQFFIASFEFNSKYMAALGLNIHAPGIIIFVSVLLLLLLFFAPFLIRSWKLFSKNKTSINLFIVLLSACSLAFMILAGTTFYSHYYLIVLPLLCLVFGATYEGTIKFKPKLLATGLCAIAVLLTLASYKQIYNSYFGSAKVEADNQATVARYINEHTNPNDTFFAYVYGATFYQLAGRDSGSRFISASHLLFDYKYRFGYGFNQQFISDMIYSEAKYVVMPSDTSDIYRVENPVAMTFIERNYHSETSLVGYDILVRNN